MHSKGQRDLEGKVALVTGASRRIGRATALELARAGADVVVHARAARDEVETVATEIRSLGRSAHVHLADLSVETEAVGLIETAVQTFGRLDILVNNAAVRRHVAFTEMTFSEWREIMGVILDGAFLTCRAAIPAMIAAGGGAIVNVGGVSAHVGARERAHVTAAKAGLVGLTKALAVEFADRSIRVNCVAPGKIGGERSKTSGEGVAAGTARPLLARMGEIEEAAGVIAALCRPLTGYMTGQTVHVNGGMFMP